MPTGSEFTEPKGWGRFWFAPASPIPLERMRVAVGVLVILWLVSFTGRQTEYFGFSSWLSRDVYASVKKLPGGYAVPDSPGSRLPTPPWSPMYFASTPAAVHAIFGVSLAAAAAFTAGAQPMITAPLTWLGVCAFTSNPIFNGAGDESLLLPLTFYLMLGFLLRPALPEGVADRFTMRLLQVHVALIVFSSAIGKMQQSVWWEGIALWFPLHPAYDLSFEKVNELRGSGISSELKLLSALAYLVVIWQITFPALAFQRWARKWIIGGAFLGMLGCWYIYRLPFFGPTWFVASLAYLQADEWLALGARLRRSRTAPGPVN